MTKFELIRDKETGKISTAVHNIKRALLDNRFYEKLLIKEAKRCNLAPEKLIKETLKAIKEENGGILPEYLQKKYKNLEAT